MYRVKEWENILLMPAKDKSHDAVKSALIKEGWIITDDPLFLRFGGVDLYVDLGAEKILAAEKENRKIAVEIKTFKAPSLTHEFHTALGQFIAYRRILRENEPDRVLYLAISKVINRTFFTLEYTQTLIEEANIKLIIYDEKKEEILEWQE